MSRSYKRRLQRFDVIFSGETVQIETLEGLVVCKAGDAIVTGVMGEKWPVPRYIFDENYYPVDPSLLHGQDGAYFRKEIVVQAEQVHSHQVVDLVSGQGRLTASIGDWIVVSADGRKWVVAEQVFSKTYMEISLSRSTDK